MAARFLNFPVNVLLQTVPPSQAAHCTEKPYITYLCNLTIQDMVITL